MESMEEEEAGPGLDPAALAAEAPRLLAAASRAMEALAAEIRSRDDLDGCRGSWMLGRGWKVAAPAELAVLKAHVLRVRSIISAGALAQQARDAAHLIDDLHDVVHYRSLLRAADARARHSTKPLLPALWKRLIGVHGLLSSPPARITREINILNEETRSLGLLLLDNGAGPSSGPPPLPPPSPPLDSGTATVVFGRDEELDDILQTLLQPHGKAASATETMVCISGTGGIGKTTLAQMAFNDARVERHFDVRCWVSVSTSSNQMELAGEILRSAQPSWGGSAEKMGDFQMLKSELCRFLACKRYLVVLDDVCNVADEMWLDILSLRSADIGSRILLTSRKKMSPHMLKVYTVNPLDGDNCWALLRQHAFPGDVQDVRPRLEMMGREIVAKINGSPLAAKLVGGVLADSRSTEHWMNIMKTRLQDGALLPTLSLSYKNLPGHLRRCFAYCSLFPQKWKFDPAHLINLWIAEGFVEPQGRAEERMEDRAREYFDQLLSRSFFQELKLGTKTYYLVHDLLHDLAKSVAEEDCFRIEDGKNAEIPPTVCHISVTMKSLLSLTSLCRLEKLRTLLIQKSLPFSFDCFEEDFKVNLKNILEKSKKLRVLDLSGSNLEELPQCIDGLLHLRYLSVHGSIKRLPESIDKLLHLQTLCFTGKCSFDKLPTGISMLVNMRHLIVETKYTAGLVGISRLANLQGSLQLHVEKREGRTLGELRNINGLRGLLKIQGLENVSTIEEACKAELNKKIYLNSLNFEWSSASRNNDPPIDAKVLEGLQPHQDIKVLHIRRYCGTEAPSWLQSLQQLQSLHLINCRSLGSLPPLGSLGSLRYLHMKELCAVDQIGHEFYGTGDVAFPSLSVLELDDFPKLCEWVGIEDENSFPCLERLSLMDCPELIKIPLTFIATREIIIERTRLISYMRLAPFSSSSEMLQLDVCTSSVIFKRLLYKHHMESIVVLNISGAEQLVTGGQPGSLVSLQRLQLYQCDLTDQTLRSFLQDLPCLSSLEIIDLANVTSLPVSETVKFGTMLTELCIRNCQSFCSLSSLQYLGSLKNLVIERCPEVTAISFPVNFRSLSYLKVLRISYCMELQSLPSLPSSLETLYIFGCHPELSRRSRNRKGHYVEKLAIVPSIFIQ